jgi:predicted amino acid racemase
MAFLTVDFEAITQNARQTSLIARGHGIDVYAVLKMTQCQASLAAAIKAGGIERFAFSSLNAYRGSRLGLTRERVLLLGPSAPSLANEIVKLFACSIQSSPKTILELAAAAQSLALSHSIYIAVRTSDDREGLPLNHKDKILKIATTAVASGIAVRGLSVNFGCNNYHLPSENYVSELALLRQCLKVALGQEIEISLGGSILLPNVGIFKTPANIRIGEALLTGTKPPGRQLERFSGGFVLNSSIVEVSPGYRRLLLDVGTNLLDPKSAFFLRDDVNILTTSGELMTVELSETQISTLPTPKVGDILPIQLGYSSINRALGNSFLPIHAHTAQS